MEATTLRCYKLSWRPISKTLTSQRAPIATRHTVMSMRFSSHGDDGDYYLGRSVDESMIVLRLRIKEMKMIEAKKSHVAPHDWMKWEKHYYAYYDKDVCEAIGLLQCYLMSLRPIVTLGLLVFVALSVMISFWVGLFHAIEIVNSFICIALSQVEP